MNDPEERLPAERLARHEAQSAEPTRTECSSLCSRYPCPRDGPSERSAAGPHHKSDLFEPGVDRVAFGASRRRGVARSMYTPNFAAVGLEAQNEGDGRRVREKRQGGDGLIRGGIFEPKLHDRRSGLIGSGIAERNRNKVFAPFSQRSSVPGSRTERDRTCRWAGGERARRMRAAPAQTRC